MKRKLFKLTFLFLTGFIFIIFTGAGFQGCKKINECNDAVNSVNECFDCLNKNGGCPGGYHTFRLGKECHCN